MAKKNKKTVSSTSPKGKRRGCLCDDGTYSKECCDGTLQAQGIGNITIGSSDSAGTINNTNTPRTITNSSS
tara:strand:+ start:12572 stop:12784 length:213 start_codon:yes stop_codon:yes gene_type:complete